VAINKPVEALDKKDWSHLKNLIGKTYDSVLVNASFSLHHVPIDSRDFILNEIKRLGITQFTLIEPWANYLTDDLLEKFRNAWKHYEVTFSAIDCMDCEDTEKEAIKRIFFGREIHDVLADNSIERYETSDMWLNRLTNVGFQPSVTMDLSPLSRHVLNNKMTITNQQDHYLLAFDGAPLVTVASVN